MRLRPAAALTAVAILVALAAGACRDGAVRVSYRPEAGDRTTYAITVWSRSVVSVPGRPDQVRRDELTLEARHHVLDVDGDVATVEVEVRAAGGRLPPRTYEVRLDRGGQLTAVDRIEGLPAEALEGLGLSEIFPAAAGAPPDRPLAPGDRWRIDEPVRLPGLTGARLQGRGRLVALGVQGGEDVATVETATQLPVRRRTSVAADTGVVLEGTQATKVSTSHRLRDGAVTQAEARTLGVFELRVGGAGEADPVTGTLEVEVRSTTRLVEG